MGKLWEAFPPARFLTGLVSPDHREGFIIINTGLFLFGLWCWLYPVRKNHKIARQLIFIWLVIEFINGVGHPFWSIRLQSYTPGLATSLLLLFLSIRITIMFFRDKPACCQIHNHFLIQFWLPGKIIVVQPFLLV